MPILIIALVFLCFVLVLLWNRNTTLKQDILDLQNKLTSSEDAARKALKKSTNNDKKDSKNPKSQQLLDVQAENKKLKRQLYDLKQNAKSQPRDQEKKQKKKDRESKKDESLFSLREELGTAMADLAIESTRANEAESRVAILEKKLTKETRTTPSSDSATGESTTDWESKFRELDERYRGERNNTRKEEKREISEIRDRLKKASRNVDRQRRRADNNDKAYKITQRQLDAARDQIELLKSGDENDTSSHNDGAREGSQRAEAHESKATPDPQAQEAETGSDNEAIAQNTPAPAPEGVEIHKPAGKEVEDSASDESDDNSDVLSHTQPWAPDTAEGAAHTGGAAQPEDAPQKTEEDAAQPEEETEEDAAQPRKDAQKTEEVSSPEELETVEYDRDEQSEPNRLGIAKRVSNETTTQGSGIFTLPEVDQGWDDIDLTGGDSNT